jgi:hypothetical protein
VPRQRHEPLDQRLANRGLAVAPEALEERVLLAPPARDLRL